MTKKAGPSLLSLGEAKLTIQAAMSIGYDTQALGLMAVSVALTGVDVALRSGLGWIWWLPLIGLGGSVFTGVAALSQPEVDTGPDVGLILRIDATAEQTEELVLASLAGAIERNAVSLVDKRGLVALSTMLIWLSFALAGVTQLLSGGWR
jgi:hypothetical protein